MFGDFSDLTDSFNGAVSSVANMAGTMMAVSAIFDLAAASKSGQDPDLVPFRSASKMILGGMLL